MHWPKAAGRIRDRGWNVYSCPWILGLTARLVLASEQAEPASEPGNRSLSSIRMHCQYRKFMQEVHAVASSNDCRERSTGCRTQGTPNGCGPQQRRANLAGISRTPTRSDLSRVATNPVRSIRWTWLCHSMTKLMSLHRN